MADKNSNFQNEISPLISVIVPIYNVRNYIRKCLDSLKKQTFDRIEVIMIDDGSEDESGEIAEEYVSNEWPVFRLIHTDNRGLSAARNRGIDEALGTWLMFVDSDDWVEPKYCEIPFKVAIKNDADLVIFGAERHDRRGTKKILNKNTPLGVIDEFTAHEFGTAFAWNKLYAKRVIEAIRYPEGRVYEDSATTHKFVHLAEKIIMISNVLYHYVDRKNSITHTSTFVMRISLRVLFCMG